MPHQTQQLIIHRDVNLIRRRATLFIGDIFPLERMFFSGNAIYLLKTIPRLVNVSYNVEIRLAFNHEHKSTPHKWLLIRFFLPIDQFLTFTFKIFHEVNLYPVVEGCFKNKKVFIEGLSSAHTILKISHQCVLLADHVRQWRLLFAAPHR